MLLPCLLFHSIIMTNKQWMEERYQIFHWIIWMYPNCQTVMKNKVPLCFVSSCVQSVTRHFRWKTICKTPFQSSQSLKKICTVFTISMIHDSEQRGSHVCPASQPAENSAKFKFCSNYFKDTFRLSPILPGCCDGWSWGWPGKPEYIVTTG